MKTRIPEAITASILLLLIVFNFGCNKSSTTSPRDFEVSGSGSDYFPLAGDQTISWTGAYQFVGYDSTGKIMGGQTVANQPVKGYIGTATAIGGTQAYPIYGYNQDGTNMSSTGLLIGQDNGSIVVLESAGEEVTLLPADFQVGTKWVANPFSQQRDQVTMEIAGGKSSYANSAGKTYSNVMEVMISFSDSVTSNNHDSYDYGTGWYSYHQTDSTQLTAKASMYFAKGVGLVDLKVDQFEAVDGWVSVDSSYLQNYWNGYAYVDTLIVNSSSGYEKLTGSATFGMTDSHQGGSVAQPSIQNRLSKLSASRTKNFKHSLIDFLFGNHKPFHENRGY